MRRLARTVLSAAGLLLVGTAAQAQYAVYAITNTNGTQQLVRFDSGSPTNATVVGLTGANLVGIDFRPADGLLYGYDGDRLYTINLGTGSATQVFDVQNAAGPVGFDFNPAADRLRLVDQARNNYRLNPNDGATIVDSSLAYTPGDANANAAVNVTAAAYTNNDNDPTTGTTLYGINGSNGTLVTVNPPNNGRLNTVGSLGLGGTLDAVNGFDIVTVGGANLAFFTAVQAGVSNFYSVNLATGAATSIGQIGVAGGVRGIAITPGVPAVIPEPSTYALVAAGLAGVGAMARRRRNRA